MTALKHMMIALISFLAMVVSPAHAQNEADATTDTKGAFLFIDTLSSKAIAVLDDTRLTLDQRNDEFRRLLREGFDLDYIGRLVLGRHAKDATAAQLKTYKDIFPEYVLQIYADRLKERGDETFKVDSTTPAGKRDIYVRSRIIRPNGPAVAADWRVRSVNGEFKIVDLKIEGISMAITQRDEFSAKITTEGMDALLDFMRHQTNTHSSSKTQHVATENQGHPK